MRSWITLKAQFQLIEFFLGIGDSLLDRVLAFRLANPLQNSIHRRNVRDLQCLVGWDVDVRRDAGAFPIGFADGVDRAAARHPDREVFVDPAPAARVRAASSGLTDYCR